MTGEAGPEGFAMADAGFYVKYKGRVHGPVPLKDLKLAVESGRLTRAHGLSRDRTRWFPAGEHAELFHDAAAAAEDPAADADPSEDAPVEIDLTIRSPQDPPPSETAPARPPDDSSKRTTEPVAVAGVTRINVGLGLGAGIGSIIVLQMPLRADEAGAVFWWHFLAGDNPVAAAMVVLALLAGVALCVVSLLVRGRARGIVFLAAGGFGLAAIVALLGQPATLWAFVPACLLAAAMWRDADRSSDDARRAMMLCGGATCGGAVVYLAIVLLNDAGPALRSGSLLQTVALMLVLLGVCSGVIAGAIGLAAARPRYAHDMTMGVQVLAHAAAFAPALGMVLAEAAEATGTGVPVGSLVFLVIRGILYVVISFYLVVFGVLEISVAVPHAEAPSEDGEAYDTPETAPKS